MKRLANSSEPLMFSSDGAWNRRGHESHLFAYVVMDAAPQLKRAAARRAIVTPVAGTRIRRSCSHVV